MTNNQTRIFNQQKKEHGRTEPTRPSFRRAETTAEGLNSRKLTFSRDISSLKEERKKTRRFGSFEIGLYGRRTEEMISVKLLLEQ